MNYEPKVGTFHDYLIDLGKKNISPRVKRMLCGCIWQINTILRKKISK